MCCLHASVPVIIGLLQAHVVTAYASTEKTVILYDSNEIAPIEIDKQKLKFIIDTLYIFTYYDFYLCDIEFTKFSVNQT